MVPRGARRSDQKAHPSRLEQVRRFLPSWPCEFDSRPPLHVKVLVKGPFAVPPRFCVTARRAGPLRGPLGGGGTNWPLEPQLFDLRRCAW